MLQNRETRLVIEINEVTKNQNSNYIAIRVMDMSFSSEILLQYITALMDSRIFQLL